LGSVTTQFLRPMGPAGAKVDRPWTLAFLELL
jgi:hypothetical protein